MKKLYLISLRIFDSRDAGFPLNYKEVTMLKREIFFEFLRHNADEHIAVDLFGDLSTPAEIFHLLSLVPKEIPLKISQSDSILKGLKFNENIYLLDEPFVMDAISNPVISSKPSFLMKEDGQELIIESGLNGCVPVELERPEDPGEGKIGFLPGLFLSLRQIRQRCLAIELYLNAEIQEILLKKGFWRIFPAMQQFR